MPAREFDAIALVHRAAAHTNALSASFPSNRRTMLRGRSDPARAYRDRTSSSHSGRARSSIPTRTPPTLRQRPCQVRSSSPSTPPITRFGRRRRPSYPNAAIAPSVATSSGRMSNRSAPSSRTMRAPGPAMPRRALGPLAAPGRTVDQRLAVSSRGRMVAEKPWMTCGR